MRTYSNIAVSPWTDANGNRFNYGRYGGGYGGPPQPHPVNYVRRIVHETYPVQGNLPYESNWDEEEDDEDEEEDEEGQEGHQGLLHPCLAFRFSQIASN